MARSFRGSLGKQIYGQFVAAEQAAFMSNDATALLMFKEQFYDQIPKWAQAQLDRTIGYFPPIPFPDAAKTIYSGINVLDIQTGEVVYKTIGTYVSEGMTAEQATEEVIANVNKVLSEWKMRGGSPRMAQQNDRYQFTVRELIWRARVAGEYVSG